MAPIEFRVGSSGPGLFLGVGTGLGYVVPVSLAGIPVVGDVARGLASSLGGLDSALGGLTAGARRRVRGLGVRNLDLGAGCGVMLGYSVYGAGLFLSPEAAVLLKDRAQQAQQHIVTRLPPPLRAMLGRPQAAPGSALRSGGGGSGGSSALQVAVPQVVQLQALPDAPGSPGQPDAQPAHVPALSAAPASEIAGVATLLVRQQAQLDEQQRALQELREAVARLEARQRGGSSSSSSGPEAQALARRSK